MSEQRSSATKRPTDRAAVLLAIDDAVRAADVREVRTLLQVLLALDRKPSSAERRMSELAGQIEGALVNSEGRDFQMDASFAREVIAALRGIASSTTEFSVTDAMVDAALAFGKDLKYLGHPKVREWRGTENGDNEEAWNRDYVRALLNHVLVASATGERTDGALPAWLTPGTERCPKCKAVCDVTGKCPNSWYHEIK